MCVCVCVRNGLAEAILCSEQNGIIALAKSERSRQCVAVECNREYIHFASDHPPPPAHPSILLVPIPFAHLCTATATE